MKKLLLLYLCLLGIDVSAQKIFSNEIVSDHSSYVKGNNFRGIIFSEKYSSSWLDYKRLKGVIYAGDVEAPEDAEQLKRFTPTGEDIISAEMILQSGLKVINKRLPKVRYVKSPTVYKHLVKYILQYFGYITYKNEKVILFNCIWRDDKQNDVSDITEEYYKIFDGGSYCWHAKVNFTTKRIFDFGVNGSL